MGVLTREMMEFGIADTNEMVSIICNMEPFPFPHLVTLRDKYIYNIRPLNLSINQLKKGLCSVMNAGMRFIDDDHNEWTWGSSSETQPPEGDWWNDQFAVATWTVNSAAGNGKNRSSKNLGFLNFLNIARNHKNNLKF